MTDNLENLIDIEEALLHLGVPDDITEFTDTFSSGPDQESIERIKHRTIQMTQSKLNKPKGSRIKLWNAIAAAVIVIVLVIWGIGPHNVVVAVNHLLRYIPGFGIHSIENVNLVAPNPIRAERDGVIIDINGVLADSKGTTLMVYVEGDIPDIKTSYLVDQSGILYPYQSYHMSTAGSGTFQNYGVRYKALPTNVDQVSLVIPSLANWTINIPLEPVSNLNSAENSGPSATVNNVIVSGKAMSFSDETKIILLVQSLRGGVLVSLEHPVLYGVDGKSYQINYQPAGFGGSGLAYFSTEPNVGDRLTVNIPLLILEQDVHGSALIPVPDNNSSLPLNKSLNLGSWNLKLTKAEVITDDGTSLRVYVEPDTYNGTIVNMLEKFSINGKTDFSWSSQFDESTGGIQWFEIPFPTGEESIQIKVDKIDILVKGPWKIEIPVTPGFN